MYPIPPIAPRYVNLQSHLKTVLPLLLVLGATVSAYDRLKYCWREDRESGALIDARDSCRAVGRWDVAKFRRAAVQNTAVLL